MYLLFMGIGLHGDTLFGVLAGDMGDMVVGLKK
jgi:hypothetical protein